MNVTEIITYEHINRFNCVVQGIKIEILFHDDIVILVI